MPKLDVTLINAQNGEAWPAEVIVGQPVGTWVDQLLEALELPREQADAPVYYRFVIERTGQTVSEDETLEAYGLQEDDTLRLERDPEAPAQPPSREPAVAPTGKAKTPWKTVAFLAGLLFVLGGLGGVWILTTVAKDRRLEATSVALASQEAMATLAAFEEQKTRQANTTQTSVAAQTATSQESSRLGIVTMQAAATAEAGTATQKAMATKMQATAYAQNTLDASPQNWPIHFQDDFSSSDDGWPMGEHTYERIDLNFSIANGIYQANAEAFKNTYVRATHAMGPVLDFYLEADVRKISGSEDQAIGVVFHFVDDENFGYFGVSNQREFIASQKINGEYQDLISWKASDAIKKRDFNHLTILAEDGHYEFFINYIDVGEAYDDQLTSGKAGFYFEVEKGRKASFEFDNFVLRAPQD